MLWGSVLVVVGLFLPWQRECSSRKKVTREEAPLGAGLDWNAADSESVAKEIATRLEQGEWRARFVTDEKRPARVEISYLSGDRGATELEQTLMPPLTQALEALADVEHFVAPSAAAHSLPEPPSPAAAPAAAAQGTDAKALAPPSPPEPVQADFLLDASLRTVVQDVGDERTVDYHLLVELDRRDPRATVWATVISLSKRGPRPPELVPAPPGEAVPPAPGDPGMLTW
jgi:hypothetical protein